MKTLTISVTEEIINSSQPCNMHRCMVAEAIQRKYPDASYVYVDTASIKFTKDGTRYWFIPPQSVKDFIAAYDRKDKVKPFKFTTAFLAKSKKAGDSPDRKRWKDTKDNHDKNPLTKKPVKAALKRVRINGVCHFVPV